MGSYELINRSPDEMTRDERVGQFQHVLENLLYYNPQGADTRFTAGAKAWARELGSPLVRYLCGTTLEWRSEIREEPMLNVAELWMRACAEAVDPIRQEIGWPKRHNREKPWRDIIYGIADPNNHQMHDGFAARVTFGTVQGNPPSRAIAPALVAQLYKYQGRFGSDTSIGDVGTGLMHTPKALKMPRNILRGVAVDYTGSDSVQAAQLRELLLSVEHSRPDFGHCTGYEVEEMMKHDTKSWDPTARRWVRINTIRPDEEVDSPHLVDEYDEVDKYKDEDISFVRADFTVESGEFDLHLSDENLHDMVNSSAMLYQHQGHPESIEAIRRNWGAIRTEWGLDVVTDFCMPSPDDPQQIYFFQERLPYTFRVLIYDHLKPELGFQEFIQFRTGRCKEARPGRDWQKIAGSTLSLAS